jgi:hypothetical protein
MTSFADEAGLIDPVPLLKPVKNEPRPVPGTKPTFVTNAEGSLLECPNGAWSTVTRVMSL